MSPVPSLGIYKNTKARSSGMIKKILVFHTHTFPKGKQAWNPAITCMVLCRAEKTFT